MARRIGSGLHAFSHADWTAVLERVVDREGRVDYLSLADDRAALDRYLESLAHFSPESHPELFQSREEALAYYLNAYNAYVFRGVLERGPEQVSVWRHPIAAFNFFVRRKIELGGERLHLKGLEDKRVRARFQDPRVHAALNCASISCPRLRREAFEADTLDAVLDKATAELVSHPQHFRLDEDRRTAWVSKVFDWYSSDFLGFEKQSGSGKPKLVDYVNRFRDPEHPVPQHFKIKFLPFDKGINKK